MSARSFSDLLRPHRFDAFLPRPSFMDISPCLPSRQTSACAGGSTSPLPCRSRSHSLGSTKRTRENDIDRYPIGTASKRMEMSPVHTPNCSPDRTDNEVAMSLAATPANFGTPIAAHTSAVPLATELRLRWASAKHQGPRGSMEDRYVVKLDEGPDTPHLYCGVFDGHGGAEASEYCAESIQDNIKNSSHWPDMVPALVDAFLKTDAEVLTEAAANPMKKVSDVGSAGVVMLATAHQLTVAHAGDCRAILVKRASAHPLSHTDITIDHAVVDVKPGCPAYSRFFGDVERSRVEQTGGKLEPGYVHVGDHNLPMTRAFGNLRLKVADGKDWRTCTVEEQVVTALPDVRVIKRSADDLAVVLATDGLFGVMSSEEVAQTVRAQLLVHEHTGDAEGKAARHLVDLALQAQSADNVAVVVVALDEPPATLTQEALQDAKYGSRSSSGEVLLAQEDSQQSLVTGNCSPQRSALHGKTNVPFCVAYPASRKRSVRRPPLYAKAGWDGAENAACAQMMTRSPRRPQMLPFSDHNSTLLPPPH
uniref:PPM-type phosphatase domain-containing protein n=1 Tax=Coccolithus braarudii TaxID=221442 RepID=A0A7S0LC56_9EUKA|mmetsp:Transcript_32554/g.69834  ORF Transcript_32554/g.69834 Transcript_32554/m.69834 type:complete len:535 (+) Transcript_32554:82-1686(+)